MGLEVTSAKRKGYDVMHVLSCSPDTQKLVEKVPADTVGPDHVMSLDLVLIRPNVKEPQDNPEQTSGGGDGCCCGGGSC